MSRLTDGPTSHASNGKEARMLTFKHKGDLDDWRSLFGKSSMIAKYGRLNDDIAATVSHITQFNALSELITGRSAVVTSWFRADNTAHYGGRAADFRIRHYESDIEKDRLENAAITAGIPIIRVKIGTPSEHWHCGQLATLAFELE